MGLDEEAIVDLGKTSSTTHTNYEMEELESHRAVYVGVHVPLGRESRRRHRHRGHRHHRKKRERDAEEGKEDGRESPSYETPSQRVQFILGTEDDDVEHVAHDLFTELDELSFRTAATQSGRRRPAASSNGTVMLDMRANSIERTSQVRTKYRCVRPCSRGTTTRTERKLSNRIPLVRSIADIGKKALGPAAARRNGDKPHDCARARACHPLRLSLQKPGSCSTSGNLSRRESRVAILLNHLLPSSSSSSSSAAAAAAASPLTTPQNTPPSRRASPSLQRGPVARCIPEVVVSPPDDEPGPATRRRAGPAAGPGTQRGARCP
ncbi:hypothetical protein CRUP_024340 [Coryphaenoides rupestris]|nr:hypothetical protein CRUP_024340 [Coryphaenoides rupestris]